ncbi:hypothetical protein DL93DRAFT_2076570 [Clavulina sp. PMI_390]|nr:hypothetical protein DL93DRAFT_2076570 [Clavulina sp. PMI_390]
MSRSKQLSAPHDHADQGDLKQTDSSTLSPQSSKSLVVLFKNREEDADVDPYTSAFEKKGLGEPIFVPVLKTGSENEERLQKVLRSGCGDGAPYGCVIVTSARAAEMWIRAAINLHTTNEGERSGPTSPNGHAGA